MNGSLAEEARTQPEAETPVVSGHTPCGCVDKVDALLAEQNSTLVTTLGFGGSPRRVIVQTEKRDPKKRGRGPSMLASFCPFCGEGYSAKATPAPSASSVGIRAADAPSQTDGEREA